MKALEALALLNTPLVDPDYLSAMIILLNLLNQAKKKNCWAKCTSI